MEITKQASKTNKNDTAQNYPTIYGSFKMKTKTTFNMGNALQKKKPNPLCSLEKYEIQSIENNISLNKKKFKIPVYITIIFVSKSSKITNK